ncbi:MAG TPA: hypothetical protein VGQ33_18465, partial [Vicinamibacteria bacterium]|nr:hypothetical protein [Vicinamibacteria bacterium]
MELLLWRWSTTVQVSSLTMIGLFFFLLARSVRMAALRWWVAAWLANLGALAVTLAFWIWQPPPLLLRFVVGPLYMGLKSAFVVLLLQGAWSVRRLRIASPRAVAVGICVYALLVPVFVDVLYKIGIVQHTVMGLALVAAGAAMLISLDPGLPWLAVGFVVRGALAFAEACAYGMGLLEPGTISPAWHGAATTFLA